jgi:hypothetical protein
MHEIASSRNPPKRLQEQLNVASKRCRNPAPSGVGGCQLEIHRNWEYMLLLPPSASSVADRFHTWLLQVVSAMERPAASRRQVEKS